MVNFRYVHMLCWAQVSQKIVILVLSKNNLIFQMTSSLHLLRNLFVQLKIKCLLFLIFQPTTLPRRCPRRASRWAGRRPLASRSSSNTSTRPTLARAPSTCTARTASARSGRRRTPSPARWPGSSPGCSASSGTLSVAMEF